MPSPPRGNNRLLHRCSQHVAMDACKSVRFCVYVYMDKIKQKRWEGAYFMRIWRREVMWVPFLSPSLCHSHSVLSEATLFPCLTPRITVGFYISCRKAFLTRDLWSVTRKKKKAKEKKATKRSRRNKLICWTEETQQGYSQYLQFKTSAQVRYSISIHWFTHALTLTFTGHTHKNSINIFPEMFARYIYLHCL